MNIKELQDYRQNSRKEWLAIRQDDFIKVQFWKRAGVLLGMAIIIMFIFASL